MGIRDPRPGGEGAAPGARRTGHRLFPGAEFSAYGDPEEKKRISEKASSLFYEHHASVFEDGLIQRDSVPNAGEYLPAWIAKPDKDKTAGAIPLHGVFDFGKEEFLGAVLYLRRGATRSIFSMGRDRARPCADTASP